MRLRLIFIFGIFVLLPLSSAGIFIEALNVIYNYLMKNGKKIPQDKSDTVALELRRLGVFMEHNNDKISLVAEQVVELNKKVISVDKKLDATIETVGKLAINIEIIKEDIEFIKNGFKKKVDVEEFAALARRVSILEKHR